MSRASLQPWYRGSGVFIAVVWSTGFAAPRASAQEQPQLVGAQPIAQAPVPDNVAKALAKTPPPSPLRLGLEVERQAQRPAPGITTVRGQWRIDFPESGVRGDAGSFRAPANDKAPWALGSRLTYGTQSAQASFGVIAARNYRLPVFMSQPLGSDAILSMPAMSSLSDFLTARTEWQFTARVQKTIARGSRGQTLSLVGDVFLPIGSSDAAPVPHTAPSSRAVRFGIVTGF